jgi:hypothetical protein
MIGGLQGAAKPRTVWFETLVITVGTFTLAHWASPGNPLFIGGEFPWIWLAPVLIALRYGTAPGAASVALLLAGWLGFNQAHLLQNAEFPKLGFLGGFLITLLCAEFSGFWQNRLRYLEQMNAYGEERLKELTRKYFLLHLSHDRLYENLISKPATLSDSLLRLRRLMAEQSTADPPRGEAPAFPGLQAMLALLTQTCQLTSAAVYRVAEDRVLPEILATVGSMPDLQARDPLIEYAVEHDGAAHINIKDLEGASPSAYLIAVPIRNFHGEWVAMLLVARMPFMAFVQDNLQILLAMVSYYADGLIASRDLVAVQRAHPNCPMDFIDVLARLVRVRNAVGIESSLVLMSFPMTGQGRDVLAEIRRTQRTLDMEWCFERGDRLHRLVLMPITGSRAVGGYFKRIDAQLQPRFDRTLGEMGVTARQTSLVDDALRSIDLALAELP